MVTRYVASVTAFGVPDAPRKRQIQVRIETWISLLKGRHAQLGARRRVLAAYWLYATAISATLREASGPDRPGLGRNGPKNAKNAKTVCPPNADRETLAERGDP